MSLSVSQRSETARFVVSFHSSLMDLLRSHSTCTQLKLSLGINSNRIVIIRF